MAGKNRENSWFGDLSIFVWKLMVSGGSWHIPDDMCTRSFRPPFGLLIELNLKLIARWEKNMVLWETFGKQALKSIVSKFAKHIVIAQSFLWL
jgi:hypothetical protein